MSTEPALQCAFDSVEDYVSFMNDPCRVIRLEWRKLRQPKLRGLTSHSWLEAYLLDGRHVRYDFFADHGLTESSQAGPQPTSELYEGRAAATHEFAHPLTIQVLRERAREAGARPYSVLEYNCHHFVLDIWNSSVIETLQRSHYPDRVKTSFLSGLEGSLGSWLGGLGASWSNSAPELEAETNMGEDANSPLACISMHKEEGSRITGEFTCIQHCAIGSDGSEREMEFVTAVRSGAVFILGPEGALIATSLPLQTILNDAEGVSLAASEIWAKSWLPSIDAVITAHIAERIGKRDLVDLLARLLKPKTGIDTPWSFASIASSSSHSLGQSDSATIVDMCYVVLKGEELRLVIYAFVKPAGHEYAKPWRLRLLSGDAHREKECSFQYSLRDVTQNIELTSAQAMLHEEIPALRTALMTHDWGFITLL